jgi:uncharacterized membrane protein YagU involved in acid resistance
MVAMILILLFSCSYAFGYVIIHPEVSYWYPVAYTAVVFILLSLPPALENLHLRKWDDKPSRG